jgi:hypothetical protein
MKSIKTNPNSAKGPDKGKIVNKLYYSDNLKKKIPDIHASPQNIK